MISDVALHTVTGIGFCAGVGWLDIAVKLAWEFFGVRYQTVAFVERDAYAARVLLARMEESSLEPAAVSDSIEDIGEQFAGVDCIVSGFPCQDISVAGKQAGIREGTRSGLWFAIAERIAVLQPRYVFLENVPAITSKGLDVVLGSLAEMGYSAEWGCLTAAAVGASHKRERWFCVAHRDPGLADASGEGCGGQRLSGRGTVGRAEVVGASEAVSVKRKRTARSRRDGFHIAVQIEQEVKAAMADAARATRGVRPGRERVFDCGEEVGVFAPGPGSRDWEVVCEEQSHLVPAIEPGVCVLADGRSLVVDASRADQLRCAGNGVVVAQAAAAFVELMRRVAKDG